MEWKGRWGKLSDKAYHYILKGEGGSLVLFHGRIYENWISYEGVLFRQWPWNPFSRFLNFNKLVLYAQDDTEGCESFTSTCGITRDLWIMLFFFSFLFLYANCLWSMELLALFACCLNIHASLNGKTQSRRIWWIDKSNLYNIPGMKCVCCYPGFL